MNAIAAIRINSRQRGKTSQLRHLLKFYLIKYPTGLPYENFILAKSECMVQWDCKTGEIKTIKYTERVRKSQLIWYDEMGDTF